MHIGQAAACDCLSLCLSSTSSNEKWAVASVKYSLRKMPFDGGDAGQELGMDWLRTEIAELILGGGLQPYLIF